MAPQKKTNLKCKKNQVINPLTGRFIGIDGPTYKKVFNSGTIKKSTFKKQSPNTRKYQTKVKKSPPQRNNPQTKRNVKLLEEHSKRMEELRKHRETEKAKRIEEHSRRMEELRKQQEEAEKRLDELMEPRRKVLDKRNFKDLQDWAKDLYDLDTRGITTKKALIKKILDFENSL